MGRHRRSMDSPGGYALRRNRSTLSRRAAIEEGLVVTSRALAAATVPSAISCSWCWSPFAQPQSLPPGRRPTLRRMSLRHRCGHRSCPPPSSSKGSSRARPVSSPHCARQSASTDSHSEAQAGPDTSVEGSARSTPGGGDCARTRVDTVNAARKNTRFSSAYGDWRFVRLTDGPTRPPMRVTIQQKITRQAVGRYSPRPLDWCPWDRRR